MAVNGEQFLKEREDVVNQLNRAQERLITSFSYHSRFFQGPELGRHALAMTNYRIKKYFLVNRSKYT